MDCCLTSSTKLQFSRCSWLLTTEATEQKILGSQIYTQRRRAYNYLWTASGGNRRGFGPQPVKKEKESGAKPPREENGGVTKARSLSRSPKGSRNGKSAAEAPNLLSASEVKKRVDIDADQSFDRRLDAIRRSALEQKELEEKRKYRPIDYDAPIPNSDQRSLGLGAKVGIGVAIVALGLVFALGDILPSGSGGKPIEQKELTAEEKAGFQAQLQHFEETLKSAPNDLEALEGAAVTHAELGEYSEAAALLEKLTQKNPKDLEAFRLLGEVRYSLRDYEGSVVAYRNAIMNSNTESLEILRGLTNALLAANRPNEAVQELLSAREKLRMGKETQHKGNLGVDEISNQMKDSEEVDPIQVDLLLGKAYSDWGHIGDAVAVYDALIAKQPEDFRGYLAKGILLRENGKAGDAERMFIQARYLAPPKAKTFVDRFSGR
eukprot:Gb_31482 [translate_table: standard]